jgi:serine phosphatase RsbU (regulator of sigma subunit)
MQRAMLPKITEIRKKLPESFVMLSPKEAVSGDFFWHAVTTDNLGNEKIIITAVDCTGHGVPGAFMSMLADAYLNQIVYQEKIFSPDEILHKLHDGIYHALQQDKSLNTDGMDISLCVIDIKNKIMEYAGAKNPLFYIQNNEQFLIKGDTISIGGFVKKERVYVKQTVDISKTTHFYIYSDGFQDQFGGNDNKKYMAKRFRDFLFEIHNLPMNEQAVMLATELDDWKDKKEQMDDIIVIGVKL